jgi:DNA repair exonuclease SbcCD nuclease subunit
MKIKVVSDLHLEFSDCFIKNEHDADVLILSGDILVAEKLMRPNSEEGGRFRDFLKRCSFQFPHVVYVAGNHEFYSGGNFYKTVTELRDYCSTQHNNIYFLERDTKVIDDVVFVGGTLWTDMNKYDPMTLHAVRDMMNDYRTIRNDKKGYTPLKPADTCERHRETRDYIFHIVDEHKDKRCVVVGHHTPSFRSCAPEYASDYLMNGAYHSELSESILDRPQIKLWTHGHTHHAFDYMIGETRVVCNPRGYESSWGTEHTGWDPEKVIEL